MKRFHYDHGTFKVDWALDGPVPWTAPAARRAGTVHLADSMDDLSEVSMQLATDRIPARPFCLVGQMTTTDPTRSPAGHGDAVGLRPRAPAPGGDAGGDLTGKWDERETALFADRIEHEIERRAPGLPRSHHRPRRRRARRCWRPRTPTSSAAPSTAAPPRCTSSSSSARRSGSAAPRRRSGACYLASASAHPGGGVHGACGANAARAALAAERRRRVPLRLDALDLPGHGDAAVGAQDLAGHERRGAPRRGRGCFRRRPGPRRPGRAGAIAPKRFL